MQEILKFLENDWMSAFILILILGEMAWIVILQINLGKIKKDQSLIGGGSRSLEGTVIEQAKNLKALDKDIHELYDISNQINTLALRSLHKIGMVRFNPFNDIGGDQSFAIALLDGKNNGLVISSLYTKEGTRVFSKAIRTGGAEKHPLTEEEKSAIKIAITKEERKI